MMKTILSNLTERLSLLESGKLTQAEMELFVEDSKELYERLIILRYKLYETNVFVPHAIVEPTLVEQDAPEIPEVEKPTFDLFDMEEEETISDEEDEIDAIEVGLFNIGDETPEVSTEVYEEQEQQIETEEEEVEDVLEEIVTEAEEEINVEPEAEAEPEVEESTSEVFEATKPVFDEELSSVEEESVQEGSSDTSIETESIEPQANFLDTIENPESTSINSAWILQIEQTIRADRSVFPLETLIGSFSLNEKLQFINELFDGSSDAFSSATKKLDACENMSIAREQLSDYASSYNWDLESEIVEDFIFKICRRYATANS
ncbi:MAG: hypothetical protein RIS20_1446 [Bacteroidota bacterium]